MKTVNADMEKMKSLIEEILDKKEEFKTVEVDLTDLKTRLLKLMKDNNLTTVDSYTGKAMIVDFDRDSLKKAEVLNTIEIVNQGLLEGQIDVKELINTSEVCFVLVREY